MLRAVSAFVLAVTIAALAVETTAGVTRVKSADGQFWDVQDTSPWGQDTGGSRPAAALHRSMASGI